MSGWMTRAREQQLIQDAAAGDREAAGALVSAHQHGVYAYILRMCGRPELAEDVVQEAFVRVVTNLDRFDPRFRFSTWLFTIARRVLLNQLEKRRPLFDSEKIGGAAAKSEEIGGRIEHDEHQTVCRDAVQRALLKLPLDQREVVVLFHQHDWPIWLISEQLGMPEGTVKSHLHRGRNKLRDLLADQASTLVGDEREAEGAEAEIKPPTRNTPARSEEAWQ